MNNENSKIGAGVKYVDIHSHLGFGDYQNDFNDVLKRMEDNGIATITVGTDLKSSQEAVKIASENKNIFACIGAHPDENFVFNEKDFAELVKNPKVVAIGECGLDYFKKISDIEIEKERQKKEFVKQIEFSIKYNKPLMLHIRDMANPQGPASGAPEAGPWGTSAYSDAYDILSVYRGKVRGNMHFFAGDVNWAKKFVELGFTISFTGVITFARQYDEVVKNIPLESIHAETDSPYVAPIPYRGKRNEPSYVVEVIKKIAEIRGETVEYTAEQFLKNAKRVFGLGF